MSRSESHPGLTLISGGLTPVEREVLRFARRYGLDVQGYATDEPIKAGKLLCPWARFWAVGRNLMAVIDNVAIADVLVLLSGSGEPTEHESMATLAAAMAGRPIVAIRPGRDWQHELAAALRRPGLGRLYVTGGDADEAVEDRAGSVGPLLTAIFNFLDPRDPAKTVMPDAEYARRIAALRERYPYQFPESLPLYMVTPEAGWLDLIDKLCADVDALLPSEGRAQFQWTQIKEKFGTLRAYWSRGPLFADIQHPGGGVSSFRISTGDDENSLWHQINALIDAATAQSAVTCGECGAPGRLRRHLWQRTLCDLHAKPGWERRP